MRPRGVQAPSPVSGWMPALGRGHWTPLLVLPPCSAAGLDSEGEEATVRYPSVPLLSPRCCLTSNQSSKCLVGGGVHMQKARVTIMRH